MTWLSEGLPRELEQRRALGPAPSSRNLSLSLPLSQLNGSLTCCVSNPVDEKNATLLLQSVCLWRGEWDLWEGLAENRAGHDWGTQGNHWDRGVLEGGHYGHPRGRCMAAPSLWKLNGYEEQLRLPGHPCGAHRGAAEADLVSRMQAGEGKNLKTTD